MGEQERELMPCVKTGIWKGPQEQRFCQGMCLTDAYLLLKNS